jgi:hypothetical protein
MDCEEESFTNRWCVAASMKSSGGAKPCGSTKSFRAGGTDQLSPARSDITKVNRAGAVKVEATGTSPWDCYQSVPSRDRCALQ